MREKRRTLNNIIILCEGTDTEYNYFTDLKNYVEHTAPDRFSKIRIIRGESEKIRKKNPKRNTHSKTMEKETLPHYYCLNEHSLDEYNIYGKQPTRYVREVQLFMEEEGFTEGWAVFDKDVHPDHEHAFQLAKEINNLHIAFSSYCFEEWLLAHFERNDKAFTVSECKDKSNGNKAILCGTNMVNDCHGHRCLGGRLREKKYIPDYTKNKQCIFSSYTLQRIEQAFMNAAWLRHLHSGNCIYEYNPYTDTDKLVARLLENNDEYVWRKKDEPFSYLKTKLKISERNEELFIYNIGNGSCIINEDFSFCDSAGKKIFCVTDKKILLQTEKSFSCKIPSDADLVKIDDGFIHVYIELKHSDLIV